MSLQLSPPHISSFHAAPHPSLLYLPYSYPSLAPTQKNREALVDHITTWRHDLPRSWMIPPHLHNFPSSPLSSCPDLDYPSSPTDSCSSVSVRTDPSPSSPPYVHVVCDVPLVVPKPRPYRCLTPLEFELPNEDQDLSHPPYTTQPPSSKRKRSQSDDATSEISKRRTPSAAAASRSSSSKVTQFNSRSKLGKPR